ncbi:MAG: type II-A CRISPR-associated protein Csn2 [Crenarchaeota archaeon]|nr:type II-A CRISPR-associated protein Csn2 [Thermoproteota archaeon]
MMLVNSELNIKILIEENYINVLVIENRSLFYNLINEIIMQIEGNDGNWVLSEESKILAINKTVSILVDYFRINYNSRSIIAKLYSNLKDLANSSEFFIATNDIKQALIEYIEKLTYDTQLPVDINTDFDFQSIFKTFDVRLLDDNLNLVDTLNTYLNISRDLTDNKLTIFVNLFDYLNDEDIITFYNNINYSKHNVIFLENKFIKKRADNEIVHIIDNDLCEIC